MNSVHLSVWYWNTLNRSLTGNVNENVAQKKMKNKNSSFLLQFNIDLSSTSEMSYEFVTFQKLFQSFGIKIYSKRHFLFNERVCLFYNIRHLISIFCSQSLFGFIKP